MRGLVTARPSAFTVCAPTLPPSVAALLRATRGGAPGGAGGAGLMRGVVLTVALSLPLWALLAALAWMMR